MHYIKEGLQPSLIFDGALMAENFLTLSFFPYGLTHKKEAFFGTGRSFKLGKPHPLVGILTSAPLP
jgi:hypothetical protein